MGSLKSVVEFEYEFDLTKSNGFPKRVMNIDRAKSEIHYLPKTSINDGLKLTWDWFLENNKEYLKRQNYFK